MYRCDVCNKVLPAGTPQVRLVAETRKKTYDVTPQPSDKEKRRARRRGFDMERSKQFSEGWEIVKEITVCPNYKTCLAGRDDILIPAVQAPTASESDAGNLGDQEPLHAQLDDFR